MKERPVIFNGEMVRAILDGRKTQTRRVMKVQPESSGFGLRFITESLNNRDTGKYFWSQSDAVGIDKPRSKPFPCPFGKVGDQMWVRETWSSDFANYYPNDRVWYAADNNRCSDIEVVNGVRGIYSPESDVHVPFRWRPSIHMPRKACRILLEITAVRVERLNDISEEDARAEGVRACGNNFGNGPAYCDYLLPNLDDTAEWYNRASDSFKSLWKSIYGAENWRANPWVWVIEFRRVEVEK